MSKNESNLTEPEEIVEQAIFGKNQFKEMIAWIKNRKGFQLECRLTGNWTQTGQFFKGNGILLKRHDGNIFPDSLYILIQEADIGKSNILIGRRIIEVRSSLPIKPFQRKERRKIDALKKIPEIIEPNVFIINNRFKKDMQNRNFFRSKDFEGALDYLSTIIQKYEVNAYIEGILFGKDQQIPCIITGTVQSVTDKQIYISQIQF